MFDKSPVYPTRSAAFAQCRRTPVTTSSYYHPYCNIPPDPDSVINLHANPCKHAKCLCSSWVTELIHSRVHRNVKFKLPHSPKRVTTITIVISNLLGVKGASEHEARGGKVTLAVMTNKVGNIPWAGTK